MIIPDRIVRRMSERCVPDPFTGCKNWTWGLDAAGYGQIGMTVAGKYRPYRAHRIAWQIAFGDIPNALHVCHKCDNPKCINVAHLFLGTDQDNMTDKVTKGRQPHGLMVYGAKLTEDQVVSILRDTRCLREIAASYGIGEAYVSQLKSGARRQRVSAKTGEAIRIDHKVKFSNDDALAISLDRRSANVVAKYYGLSVKTIYRIRRGTARVPRS